MLEFLTDWLQRLLRQPAKLMYIGGSDILPPPLAAQEEQTLLQQAAAGDEAARARLIERNLRLVVYIARRFENTGVNIEDLISIGTIGLIKAVGTFKSDRNIKLATYASRCIENEILMYLRKNSAQRTEVSFDEPLNTDGDGNELDLRNSGDGRIKLQAHWDAKVVRQPVQIETELISNGSDGLAYGDTLEMTAVVNVQPTDAKWSIRWQYSQDGEHFEDVEGANEMRYAVKLDKINAQYYWRFVVSVED
mgnify:CR=1 FL=1